MVYKYVIKPLKGFKLTGSMKLLTTVILAAAGQDYDFYASGESYRFGSVGDFSHTAGTNTAQADGWVAPVNSDDYSDNSESPANPANDSQFAHLNGIFADNVRYLAYGHGGNRRFCHTTRNNRAVYNWTSNKYGGYFAEGRNFMECMGEELYCFIEERAHYGQIIGITAGCEQMMNHPSVTIQDQQELISNTYTQINAIKNNYNQEAARGGANRHGFFTYYGLGGCLAMPAQNGHHYTYDRNRFATGRGTVTALDATQETTVNSARDMLNYPNSHRIGVDSPSWRSYKWLNYYRNYHGGYGQNQCLRFPKQRLEDAADVGVFNPNNNSGDAQTCSSRDEGSWVEGTDNCTKRVSSAHTYTSPGQLLPFGVSVCRACCVAEFYRGGDFTTSETVSAGVTKEVLTAYAHDMLCNYPPDSDQIINEMTDEQFEELIPRFDMAGAAFNAFQTPNEQTKVMDPNQDNNLFVHGSWCDEPGPARGCARVPNEQWPVGSRTSYYLWGANFEDDTTISALEFRYTCDNNNLKYTNPSSDNVQSYGVSPISSAYNRDWCPGRPWLAKIYDDPRHTKPVAANTVSTSSSFLIQG